MGSEIKHISDYKDDGLWVVGVTPTANDRWRSLELLEKWVLRQSRPLNQWIVAFNDHGPGLKSFFANLLEIDMQVKLIDGGNLKCLVLFLEDDDYYGPYYVTEAVDPFSDDNLMFCGNSFTPIYHIGAKLWRISDQKTKSTLSQTVVKYDGWEIMRNCILKRKKMNEAHVDVEFWNRVRGKHFTHIRKSDSMQFIGVKGLYDVGLGAGHRKKLGGYKHDKNMDVLRKWVGNDFDYLLSSYTT